KNKAAQDSNDNQVKDSDEYVPDEEKITEYMKQLIKHSELVVVFDPTGTNGNLEDAIANAMLKSIKFRRNEKDSSNNSLIQIEMELKWCLIARVASATLYEAFSRNHVEFVNLMMENGVSIKDLKIEQLEPEQLKMFCARILNNNPLPLHETIYSSINMSSSDLVEKLFEKYLVEYVKADPLKPFDENKIETLYLWFLFMNRPEMAKFLCSICQNQTMASLLAVKIYRKAAKYDRKNENHYKKIAKEFDEDSKGIIDECFAEDHSLAIDIIENNAVAFYNYKPLRIAKRADCEAFLASDTIDEYLSDRWYHEFDRQYQPLNMHISVWVFLASVFLALLPIVAVLWPPIYKKSSTKSKETNKLVQYRMILPNELISTPEKTPDKLCSKLSRVGKRIKDFYDAPVVKFYYHFFIKSKGMPHGYFLNSWNWMDLAGIICYISAFITRFIVGENVFAASKILMSIDFIIWCIRILYFCTVFELLGPKLVMIYKMMRDTFLIFVCFILVFLFAFSIASWSLLNTNNQITWLYAVNGSFIDATVSSEDGKWWNWHLLRDLLNWGIWKVFGQVAEPYKNNATDMDAVSENDVYGTFVFLYATVFVVLSNILLLNVLIAMFNQTIGDVIKKSKTVWRYQRFWLVDECNTKTILPPPLSIVCHLVSFIIYLLDLIICCARSPDKPESENNYYQMNLEKVYAEKYWKSNVFNRDVKPKTDLTLERLETK
ncbi:unnamed protein product, partial [Rotaria magnacalcarata]